VILDRCFHEKNFLMLVKYDLDEVWNVLLLLTVLIIQDKMIITSLVTFYMIGFLILNSV